MVIILELDRDFRVNILPFKLIELNQFSLRVGIASETSMMLRSLILRLVTGGKAMTTLQ